MDTPQARYEGWALIELFGHQREAGYVTTQYFGSAAMFQVDVPELAEREYALTKPQYIDGGGFCAAGTVVRREARSARTRLVSPGAVYALNPCDEQAAMAVIEELHPRSMAVVSLPDAKQIEPTASREEGGVRDGFISITDTDPEDDDPGDFLPDRSI